MLDLVLAEKFFNHVGGKQATLISDRISRVPKFVKYILPQELSYLLLYRSLSCLDFSPLSHLVNAHSDILFLHGSRVNRYNEFHAPLVKWLESHLRIHRHFIPWIRLSHPLALITLNGIYFHILIKSGTIIAYL